MATSSDKPAPFVRKYDKDLHEALEFGRAGDFDKAHEAAQYHLTDPTLPRWHQIKHMIVSFIAIDDLEEKQNLRLRAEKVYEEARRLTPPTNKYDNDALTNLRKELDDLKTWEDEELEEEEAYSEDDDFLEDEDIGGDDLEDEDPEDKGAEEAKVGESSSKSTQATEQTLSATDPADADVAAGKSPATPIESLPPPPGTLRIPFRPKAAAPREDSLS